MSSRIDDERQAARAAERQAEARRNEDAQRSKKSAEASTFKKLVGQQQQQGQVLQQRAAEKDKEVGKSVIASLLESAEALASQETKEHQQSQKAFSSRLGASLKSDGQQQTSRKEGAQQQAVGESGRQASEQGTKLATADKSQGAKALDERKADAAHGREALADRKESSEAGASTSSSVSSAGGAMGEKGDLKADADKGGGQQGGGQNNQKDNAPAMQPGFRFNPALMAPVPVAKQKDLSGSERLRKVANELAQKIVEKVRVGTNAAGKIEFQIDLRSDVLKGLSVKVSSHNGKIKAVFQGSDRDVLKMIEEQREALTNALSARGLSLEDFRVEGRK